MIKPSFLFILFSIFLQHFHAFFENTIATVLQTNMINEFFLPFLFLFKFKGGIFYFISELFKRIAGRG